MRLALYVAVAFTLGLTLLLTGCAAFGPNIQVMSPEQLQAYARDNKASGACNITMGAGWTSKTTFATSDEDKANGSSVSISSENCGISITTTPVPRVPAVPAVVQLPVPGTPSAPVVPVPGASFVAPTSYAINSMGECIQTSRDATGRVTGAAVAPREKCQ